MNNQLKQVKVLMKANKVHLARRQLEQYLKDNPEDAQAWHVASFLQPTRQARLAAIQRAAKLKSAQPDIQKRLAKLQSARSVKLRFSRLSILAAVVVAAVIISATAPIVLNSHIATVPNTLPTLAVLQGMTTTPAQPTITPENQSKGTPISTAVTPVLQHPITPTELPSKPFVATRTLYSPQPTSDIQPFVSSPISSPLALIPVTTLPSTPIDNAITLTPIDFLAATLPPPSPTYVSTPSTGGNAVPLNVGVYVAAGEFRVVEATRNAESLIQDLGGSFPPAPANQSWMLLELLLVCQNGATYAFHPSTLKIISPSGAVYSYSPQLNLTPIFGTLTENNQVWGYLGFVVPTSESTLDLTFIQNGQVYAFALE